MLDNLKITIWITVLTLFYFVFIVTLCRRPFGNKNGRKIIIKEEDTDEGDGSCQMRIGKEKVLEERDVEEEALKRKKTEPALLFIYGIFTSAFPISMQMPKAAYKAFILFFLQQHSEMRLREGVWPKVMQEAPWLGRDLNLDFQSLSSTS